MQHTSPGAAADDAVPDLGPMSIGTVLGLLRQDFPDITVSKIRFLETEKLVEPQRTPSGYRKFTVQDMQRLAQVLRMQRDHYLPLKVIRERLEAQDRGEALQSGGPAGSPDVLAAELETAVQPVAQGGRASRAELLSAAEVDEPVLADWEAYGLICAGEDGCYCPATVEIAALLAKLGKFGLEPRHLRAVRAAAEREAGFIEQLMAPLRKRQDRETRSDAEVATAELAGLSLRLHASFLQAEIRARLA